MYRKHLFHVLANVTKGSGGVTPNVAVVLAWGGYPPFVVVMWGGVTPANAVHRDDAPCFIMMNPWGFIMMNHRDLPL